MYSSLPNSLLQFLSVLFVKLLSDTFFPHSFNPNRVVDTHHHYFDSFVSEFLYIYRHSVRVLPVSNPVIYSF